MNVHLFHMIVVDLQLSLVAGEEVEIDYEVDGWYYVS
jgi:hypothetical protein